MTEHAIRLSSSLGSLVAVAKQGARERRLLASVIALVSVTAIAVPAIVFSGILSPGDKHSLRVESRVVPPPTVAQPFGFPATKIMLADASNTLGAPVTLPNTPLASSSNLGRVWARTVPGHDYEIALTFPSSSLIVYYERPVPYPEPPATMYQTEASQEPEMMSATDLNGVPALATKQDSDQLGTNFGSIEFVTGNTRIAVLGHYDEATLKGVAQSIVDQTG